MKNAILNSLKEEDFTFTEWRYITFWNDWLYLIFHHVLMIVIILVGFALTLKAVSVHLLLGVSAIILFPLCLLVCEFGSSFIISVVMNIRARKVRKNNANIEKSVVATCVILFSVCLLCGIMVLCLK